MKWLFGAASGGGGGRQGPANPVIATSGKWLATVVAIWAAIFWTPDAWDATEPMIVDAIAARYEGMAAELIYWLLKVAAYPLMFFATRMALGLAFMALVMGVLMNLFGRGPGGLR